MEHFDRVSELLSWNIEIIGSNGDSLVDDVSGQGAPLEKVLDGIEFGLGDADCAKDSRSESVLTGVAEKAR